MLKRALLFLAVCSVGFGLPLEKPGEKIPKEWAFLIFLNGHNNLSPYGDLNINQLETVGSTADVDVVVQWGKQGADNTYRLRVEKDQDEDKVTSPFVETLPRVDMGDYKELVKFVKWSVEHYPAKRYFVSFWNHGSGWHRRSLTPTRGISFDDYSGNHITTVQMGLAMKEIAGLIGHKVDVVGADACLMAMVEVGHEMSEYVDTFVASEDLEPGLGWPYHTFFERWANNPKATANEVGTYLVDTYYDYLGTKDDITLSAMDLNHMDAVVQGFSKMGSQLLAMPAEKLKGIQVAGAEALAFAYKDYVDLGHWLKKTISLAEAEGGTAESMKEIAAAMDKLIVNSKASSVFADAMGASFWLPSTYVLDKHAAAYSELRFSKTTGWLDVLKKFERTRSPNGLMPLFFGAPLL